MDIETGKTPIEQDYLSFKNTYNEKVTLVAFEGALRCAIREDGDISMHAPFTHFMREEVKAILPYLQGYVNNGTLELQEAGTDIVDQGKRIEALIETSARMNVRNYRYEQLLLEWKKYGQSPFDSKSPDELVHLTDELIRESARSVEGVNDLEKANKAKAYYMRQCDKQVDHIANLEELLEEWSKFGECVGETKTDCKSVGFLQEKTTQLLGDDNDR